MAAGAVIGLFPVPGPTTTMSAIVAFAFRLNMVAVQLINYLLYPLQIALIIPFVKVGQWVFGDEGVSLSAEEFLAAFKEDWTGAIGTLWSVLLKAVGVWALVGVPTFLIVYYSLIPVLREFSPKRNDAI